MARSKYYGTNASWVKEFQQFLAQKGFSPGASDGIWGTNTEKAYQSFVSEGGNPKDVEIYSEASASATTTGTTPSGSSSDTSHPTHQQLVDYISKNYPSLLPLMDIPEIRDKVIIPAIQGKWGEDKIYAAYRATDYWKAHSTSQSNWLTLSVTERGQKRLDVAAQLIGDLQQLYGTHAFKQRYGNPTPQEFIAQHFTTVDNIASGVMTEAAWRVLAQNDAIKYPGSDAAALNIQHQYDMAKMLKTPQEIAESLFQEAHKDYFINLTKAQSLQWANNIVQGKSSLGEFENYERSEAAKLYPAYKDSINNGVKPGTLFAPALNTLGNELEMSPDQVIADPKLWGEITAQASGSKQPFTSNDWIQFARSLPSWNRTAGAHQIGSDFASALLKEFGKIG